MPKIQKIMCCLFYVEQLEIGLADSIAQKLFEAPETTLSLLKQSVGVEHYGNGRQNAILGARNCMNIVTNKLWILAINRGLWCFFGF